MSSECEDRIGRLLLTLSVNAPTLDTVQIRNFLIDLANQAEADERRRVGVLVDCVQRRLSDAKGKGWRQHLDDLKREVETGQSVIEYDRGSV